MRVVFIFLDSVKAIPGSSRKQRRQKAAKKPVSGSHFPNNSFYQSLHVNLFYIWTSFCNIILSFFSHSFVLSFYPLMNVLSFHHNICVILSIFAHSIFERPFVPNIILSIFAHSIFEHSFVISFNPSLNVLLWYNSIDFCTFFRSIILSIFEHSIFHSIHLWTFYL